MVDGFVKSPISALCAISQNFTYAKYAAFFEIAQALNLNFLQSRQIATFYECIMVGKHHQCGELVRISQEGYGFGVHRPETGLYDSCFTA